MIEYLMEYFHPTEIDSQYSLSIHYGRGGARLSHDHEKQVLFTSGLTLKVSFCPAIFITLARDSA